MLPWHRAAFGGVPRRAAMTWGFVYGRVTQPIPCSSMVNADGEIDTYEASDDTRMLVAEYFTDASAASIVDEFPAGQSMGRGWTELRSKHSADASLFARSDRPWVCVVGSALRDRVRALLMGDDRLPQLVSPPRDVANVLFFSPCVAGACTSLMVLSQYDHDARAHAVDIKRTHRLPAVNVTIYDRASYATPALASAAAREGQRVGASISVRGNDVLSVVVTNIPEMRPTY